MKAETKRGTKVTDQELRRAEEGLVRLLHAKHFPREWIERHVADVMAQARTDFAARLAAGRKDDTVNLLVVIGYRRAMKVLDAERARPSTTSLDAVFHLADESTPTPEEEAIESDRQERVVKAMGHLPDRERALLALVYFDGKSVRDAGRRLGWGKSSADRHHRAALERLHEMLDRSLLSPELPIPAYIAARHWEHFPLRGALRWVEGVIESVSEGLILGAGRLVQLGETGTAAATSGAGRTAAGVCGAAVALCLTGAATGVVGPGVGGISADDGGGKRGRPAARPEPAAVQTRIERASPPSPTERSAEPGGRPERRRPKSADPTPVAAVHDPVARERSTGNASRSPEATARQTVEEFGVEGTEVEAPPQPPQPAPSPESVPAPSARPADSGSSSSGSGSSTSSGSDTGSEFEM